ncbi:MAG: tetratricopeptide repeat protein [Bacteroidia bacterium]|nr:tetratricopeptide repeat protein [Bacteroidia bacterium]
MKKVKKKTKEQEIRGAAKQESRKPAGPGLSKLHIFLALAVTFVFMFPVVRNGFINFDDPQYVLENPVIQKLDKESMGVIFGGQILGNYQPLVLISYAVQYKLFGTDSAAGYHFFSLLMHLLNTFLVLIITHRLLKNHLAALFVALLFGVHPLHVESVAWVAAQKDTFYVFFFLCGLFFYLRYLEKQERKWLWWCFAVFILSAFSKAQAVVLPIVLMLVDMLDGWPQVKKRILNKIPFLVVSVIIGMVAIQSQKAAGAMHGQVFTPGERMLFASYGFENYLLQTFFPFNLSIFYPYPETNLQINSNWVYLGLPVVLLTLLGAVWAGRKHPMVLFGFLFFCVNIALVIQLIPVGDAIHADRYTYLSLLGFFWIAGYFFRQGLESGKLSANNARVVVGAVTLYFGSLTFLYAQKWSDSISIYTHSLENHPAPIVYSNRAAAYHKEGKLQEALADFNECIAIKDHFPNAYKNRGLTYIALGKNEEALADFHAAIRYKADDLDLYFTRGNLLKNKNDIPGAFADFNKVIELNPNVVDAWQNRAECYYRMGKLQEALTDLNKALVMKPDYANAYFNRSITLRDLGNIPGAIADAQQAQKYGFQVDPGYLSDLQNRQK